MMKQCVVIYQMLRDSIRLYLQVSPIQILHFYVWQRIPYTDNILYNHLHHKSSSFILYEAIFPILRMIDDFTYDKRCNSLPFVFLYCDLMSYFMIPSERTTVWLLHNNCCLGMINWWMVYLMSREQVVFQLYSCPQ